MTHVGAEGMHYEMEPKRSRANFWVHIVQPLLFLCPTALLASGPRRPLLAHFGPSVWAIVVGVQVARELVPTRVIEYSDTIVTGSETWLSIVLSSLGSVAEDSSSSAASAARCDECNAPSKVRL